METVQTKTVNRAAAVQPAAAPKTQQQGTAAAAAASVRMQMFTTVSSPSDPAEHEADATARSIMRMSAPESAAINPATPHAGVYRSAGQAGNRVQPAFHSPSIRRFADAGIVARSSDGSGNLAPGVAAGIQNSMSSGDPLPDGVRGFMEPRFGADFGSVRIHTDENAATLNRQVNAQAFAVGNHVFFGRDRFQPGSHEGKELIAHELTHTIQQGSVVQRRMDVNIAQRAPYQIQRWGFGDVLDYFADKANNIPGFRMLTLVLGVNPISMNRVERSAANILRAMIEIVPGGGLIRQALDNYGIFDRIGTWVEAQFRRLSMSGAAMRKALDTFLDSIGWRDVFHLGDLWNRAKRIFTDPVDQLIRFAGDLVTGIVKFIKDAILRPLAGLAQGKPGYDLLRAVLKQDPITGEPYPRNAESMIGGFMKLIGREDVWENIKKGNAIARAWAWFQDALKGLMGFVTRIPSLFVEALRSLTLSDIVLLPTAFLKIWHVFTGFVGEFISWAGSKVVNLLEIIFSVVAPGAVPYINKAAGAFRTIIQNPIGFVGNLVRAGILGFKQFAANFLTHLRASLIGWLTGTLSGANIYVPAEFSLKEIIKFVLSVLGLTWQNIRAKLVRVVGEPVVAAMETGFDIVVTLVTEGPAAAWEKIKESITNLKELVMEQIMTFVAEKVVQKAITTLLTSLNPAGAFIQAIIAIYNTIMFFVERLKQIAQVAMSFIDSIASIAGGVVTAAANRVEQTMAGLLTLVISFLARIAGLGKVSDAVVAIVTKIRAPIDKALDKVVEWIVMMAKKGFKMLTSTVGGLLNWWKARLALKTASGESHALYFSGEGAAAQLVLASDPMPITAFLDARQQAIDKDPKKKAARAEIRRRLAKIEELAKLPEDQQQARQAEFTDAFTAIGQQVVLLFDDGEWGSQTNPLPFEYTKRRAAAYPVLFFGPRSSATISQSLLYKGAGGDAAALASIDAALSANEREAWQKKSGRAVKRYSPLEKQALPDGGVEIGLSPKNQVAAGMVLNYDKGHTGGGSLLNDALRPYGFSPKGEGLDADHVVEMQIGGENDRGNLWPLDKSENRSSGSKLKNLQVDIPDGRKLTLEKAQEARQGKGLWLVIVKTAEM